MTHWFALDDSRPLFAFAGIWRLWTGERKGETGEHQLFAFLATTSNDVVRPIHAKAMPVLLTTDDEWNAWLDGSVELGMAFVARSVDKRCVLRDNRVSIYISWRQAFLNDVTKDAEIIAGEFNGPLYLPNERTMTVFRPGEIRRVRFTPTLSLSREVCWVKAGKKASCYRPK